ncbi:MAG: hypothetical protein IRY91_00075 [Gemmatimonadaceae bacterium]|nr:hypothetical protein [Gemmatimonadaceae bacterium]
MQHLAFVTYRDAPALSADDALAAESLARLGVRVTAQPWDDDGADWSRFRAIVLRSCWNYHRDPDRFTAWLDRLVDAGAVLVNPPTLLRWNVSKSYLLELQQRGAPVIATIRIPRGAATTLDRLAAQSAWTEVVVKPVVSADGHGARRFRLPATDHDERAFHALLQDRDVLVQPFVPEVIREGEWSFVFLGGAFSHAVVKRPSAQEFRVQARYGGTAHAVSAPPELVEQAAALLRLAPARSVYARVDGCVVGSRLTLMELELLEPALYLACDQGAPDRFARVLMDHLEAAAAR